MKKKELMSEILNNKEKVPPKDDPRLSSIIADLQHLLNTGAQVAGDQVVLPGFASFSVAHHTQLEEQRLREITAQDEDALTLLMSDDESTDKAAEVLCSVDHESGRITDPIRMTWDAFGSYAHLSNGRVEGPFNTYIPEPLRNADGTPIYVHANGSRSVSATDGASSAGMFAQKSAKQQDLSSMDPLIYGDSSLSSYDAGSKK